MTALYLKAYSVCTASNILVMANWQTVVHVSLFDTWYPWASVGNKIRAVKNYLFVLTKIVYVMVFVKSFLIYRLKSCLK